MSIDRTSEFQANNDDHGDISLRGTGEGDRVLLAQAEDLNDLAPADIGGQTPATGPSLPSAAAAPDAGQAGSVQTLVADSANQVQLPAGSSLGRMELRGQDLVIIQPDGSEIIIQNAAANVPTFIIDGVVIPQEALIAALEGNEINIAAGPNGTLVASSAAVDSSGANFFVTPPGIGDAVPILGLLPPTALQFTGDEERRIFPVEPDEEPLDIVSILPSGGVGNGDIQDPELPGGSSALPGGSEDSFIVTIQAGSSAVTNVVFDPFNGTSGDISGITTGLTGADTSTAFTYQLSADGKLLTILADGVPVVQLEIMFTPGADNIAAGATGTVAIDVTLLEAFPHEFGSSELLAIIQGIPVLAEDASGFND
ncbi:hypothetical protein E2A64_17675, partial [Pseudohoeflea suaedae]